MHAGLPQLSPIPVQDEFLSVVVTMGEVLDTASHPQPGPEGRGSVSEADAKDDG
jgi:hypothetical protein